jgi:hypothetical protein
MSRRIIPAFAAMNLFALGVCATPATAQTLVATYLFNDTLAAEEAGVPALSSVVPLGRNGFEDAVVNGQNRRVYR